MIADIRYALRLLRKTPGFTLFAVMTLALGIGGNVAIFSLVNAVLIRPLSYPDADRLVVVWEDAAAFGFPRDMSAPANFADWKSRNHVFEEMAALRSGTMSLTGGGAEPESVEAVLVTANFFPTLGIRPLLGRTFLAEEDDPAGAKVAVLSRELWVRRYASDARIIGQQIRLNDVPHTVIGVMSQGFDFPQRPTLWVPMAFTSRYLSSRTAHSLHAVARLRPGMTLAQASADMVAIGKQLEQEHPETNARLGVAVVPLRDELAGNLRVGLLVLLAAVGGVLGIACANIANLMLVRASVRRREMAIRSALGASRSRLVRQTLVESLVLSGLGAGCGLVLAWWSLAYIRKLIPEALAPSGLQFDARVLWFTAGLTLITGILAGAGPAIRLSGSGTARHLKEGGRGTAGTSGRNLRGLLVAVEVGLAVMLLTNSGLLIRTLSTLRGLDPGFRPDHVMCARTDLPATSGAKYHDAARREAFYQRVMARLKEMPGVVAAGYVSYLPLTHRGGTSDIAAEGRPAPRPGEEVDANLRVVTPDYLRAIGVNTISGRELSERDGPEALPAALVNQAMAREYWANENPIGRRFRLGSQGTDGPWITVVGVVGDIRQMGLDVPAHPEMYLSYRQFAASYAFFAPRDLAVRTSGQMAPLAAAIRQAVAEADPDQPVSRIQPMESLLASELGPRSLQTTLLAGFAALALFLASLGIYGVLSYTLSQRIPEMGLRLALGARPADIIRSVLASGLRPVVAGLAAGLPGAWLLARLMKTLLYYVSPFEPVTFGIVTALLLGVSFAASYAPARTAAAIQPMRALRSE